MVFSPIFNRHKNMGTLLTKEDRPIYCISFNNNTTTIFDQPALDNTKKYLLTVKDQNVWQQL
jgi:hypothetical protein